MVIRGNACDSSSSTSSTSTDSDCNPTVCTHKKLKNVRRPCPRAYLRERQRALRCAQLRQAKEDALLLSRGMRFFEDLCNCTKGCFYRQMLADNFVRSMIASIALFSIGMKLTREMVAWNISF